MHLGFDRFQYQSRSSQNLQRAAPAQYHGPALYKARRMPSTTMTAFVGPLLAAGVALSETSRLLPASILNHIWTLETWSWLEIIEIRKVETKIGIALTV